MGLQTINSITYKKVLYYIPNILTNFTDMNNAVQQLHDLIIHKQWRIQLLAGLSIGSQIALKLGLFVNR